ncbi:hypothetical protein IAI10_20305 [Clostridium sp. 19966]|uniref:hypothetical protein n=1 Tax=Clostridium sp. 19966 TaxID=2768166 RepID=UPI0028E032E1|nr:hypothetical protein [Clostridium sp. 19966]MDT8719000.1 hypothetical protein [Clostridium sp. 19966]
MLWRKNQEDESEENLKLFNEFMKKDKKSLIVKKIELQNEVNKEKYKESDFNFILSVMLNMGTFLITFYITFYTTMAKDRPETKMNFLNFFNEISGFIIMYFVYIGLAHVVCLWYNQRKYKKKYKYIKELEYVTNILDNYDTFHDGVESNEEEKAAE